MFSRSRPASSMVGSWQLLLWDCLHFHLFFTGVCFEFLSLSDVSLATSLKFLSFFIIIFSKLIHLCTFAQKLKKLSCHLRLMLRIFFSRLVCPLLWYLHLVRLPKIIAHLIFVSSHMIFNSLSLSALISLLVLSLSLPGVSTSIDSS